MDPHGFNIKGKVQVKHWTATEQFKSLKALADAVGLSEDYQTLYAFGSKFVHGSALLENLYTRNGQMGALSNPGLCSKLSLLAASQCVRMLREAASFFGVPFSKDDFSAWHLHWLQCYQQVEQQV